MPRVVRMMAHVETDTPRSEVTHVYLHGAAALRSDLTRSGPFRTRSPVAEPTRPDRVHRAARPHALSGPVLVVGAGLLGTSIGLALRAPGRRGLLARRQRRARAHRQRPGRRCDTAARGHADRPAGRGGGAAGPPRRRDRRRAARAPTPSSPTSAASRTRRCEAVAARVDAEALARYVGSHPMAGSERSGPLAAASALLRRTALGDHPARAARPRRWRRSPRWPRPAAPPRSPSPPTSTTRRWPAPRTCRTCSRPWSRAGSPTPRPTTWRCPARASATSPGSPPGTRGCGSRSSPPTPMRSTDLLGAGPRRPRPADGGTCARAAAPSCRRSSGGASPVRRSSPASTAGPPQPRPACSSPYRTIRGARPTARRLRRDRRQRRGPAHRPRSGPPRRAGRAHRRREQCRHLLGSLADRGWTTHR